MVVPLLPLLAAASSMGEGEPGVAGDGLLLPFLEENAMPFVEFAAASTVSSKEGLRGGVRRAELGSDLDGKAESKPPMSSSGRCTAGSDRARVRSGVPPARSPARGGDRLDAADCTDTPTAGLGVSVSVLRVALAGARGPPLAAAADGTVCSAVGAVAVTVPVVARKGGTLTAADGRLLVVGCELPDAWLLLDKLLLPGRIFTMGLGLQPMPQLSVLAEWPA